MPQVYLSIGSNIERERYVRAALIELEARYGQLIVSSVYESEAVGFEGDNFYNLVVAFNTGQMVNELAGELRKIELRNGRSRNDVRFVSRTLDIDLLLYGDEVINKDSLQLPRDEITRYAFVLQPLAEIAPNSTHPTLGQSYQSLWQAFDSSEQPLWTVPFPA
ncbi:MAG: 2-amino-4-hydroxy-6-hydroxymethyldihydropteridine diphosphokinase [Gammaproteobacteria bacterium]|nr:2-amino-4-hydroxy-6-hydroxymethyldihydropteridine diphosphokinase [Gammaproteobacteria bacterium]